MTLLYPEKKMIYLGFCSTARGLGCMLGPVVGQVIYTGTKYDFGLTFYIFAGIIAPFMLLALFMLPRSLNKKANHQEQNPDESKAIYLDEYQFSYLQILKNFRAVLSLISAITILILTLFFDAIISPHYEHIGISKDVIGKKNSNGSLTIFRLLVRSIGSGILAVQSTDSFCRQKIPHSLHNICVIWSGDSWNIPHGTFKTSRGRSGV